jgi:hypothetical protein
MVNGTREDRLDPAYHLPWGREDVFAYTDFGKDVIEKLKWEDRGLLPEPEMDLDVAVGFDPTRQEERWK